MKQRLGFRRWVLRVLGALLLAIWIFVFFGAVGIYQLYYLTAHEGITTGTQWMLLIGSLGTASIVALFAFVQVLKHGLDYDLRGP